MCFPKNRLLSNILAVSFCINSHRNVFWFQEFFLDIVTKQSLLAARTFFLQQNFHQQRKFFLWQGKQIAATKKKDLSLKKIILVIGKH